MPWNPSPLRWSAIAAVLALTACTGTPTGSPGTPTPDTASASRADAPAPASLGQPFATRHARFSPVAFQDMPGWSDDAVRDGLTAFLQSCGALSKRSAWQAICPQAQQLNPQAPAALRRFFEDHFHAYAVQDAGEDDEGIITGYYEPILNGSRQRSARHAYPVYGVPADLLFLDSRKVQDGQQRWLRLDKRQLVPAEPRSPGSQPYRIRLAGLTAGIRDKRYRVRIQQEAGHAVVVPYWNRQDIERRRLDAQVLAWVDDAYALYSMQIQGSGKIRLDGSGEIVRVAYGEQNGHPFLPQVSSSTGTAVSTAVKTRGLYAGATVQGAAAAPGSGPDAAAGAGTDGSTADAAVRQLIAALGGNAGAATAVRPAAATAGASVSPERSKRSEQSTVPQADAAEVAAIIAALQGKGPPPVLRPGSGQPAPPSAATASLSADGGDETGTSTGIPDPSYVFFRRIPDGPQGPLGALGVPLTPGQSIAVDPRSTPLGFPVFLSTVHGGSNTAINRLVFAQDTGGAIRGSVRADYFWGTGAQAGRQAASMKSPGRMWLLMPRTQEIAALSTLRTRSAPGMAAGPQPDCVIADEEFCAEDWIE